MSDWQVPKKCPECRGKLVRYKDGWYCFKCRMLMEPPRKQKRNKFVRTV